MSVLVVTCEGKGPVVSVSNGGVAWIHLLPAVLEDVPEDYEYPQWHSNENNSSSNPGSESESESESQASS